MIAHHFYKDAVVTGGVIRFIHFIELSNRASAEDSLWRF